MKLYKGLKIIINLLIVTITVNLYCITAYAGNDGEIREDPYGDSGYDSSYGDVEYYDCFIPYNTTYKELGGIAASQGQTMGKYDANPMPEATQSSYIGEIWNVENDHLSSVLSNTILGVNKIRNHNSVSISDEDGLCILTDKNGNKYYIGAVGPWTIKAELSLSSQYALTDNGFGLYNQPQIFDAILEDGTCLHFVTGDAIGSVHSNGGPNFYSSIPLNQIQDGVRYATSDSKYPQYNYMFQCQVGHFIEIWANGGFSNFQNKFNLGGTGKNSGSGKDINKVVVIRMYNATIDDPPERLNGSEPFCKVNDNGERGTSGNISSNNLSIGIVDEKDLEGMPIQPTYVDKQGKVSLPTRDDLSITESESVAIIKENEELVNSTNALNVARRVVIFIGLIFIAYALLLTIGGIVDMTNNWIDFSMVRVFTFGTVKLQVEDDEKTNPKGYITKKKLIVVICILVIVGLLIISGGMFKFASRILLWFSKKFL